MIGGNHAHPLSSLLPPPKSQSLFLSFPSPFPYLPPPTKFCFVLLLTSPPVQSSPILPPRRIQRQQNTREFLVCFSVSYSPLSSFPLYSPLSSFPLYSPLSPFNHHLTPPCPQKPKKKLTPPTQQDLERQIHPQRSLVYASSVSLFQLTHTTSLLP